MYIRKIFPTLLKRILEPRGMIQVLLGPRQVGKTTGARYIIEQLRKDHRVESIFAAADEPELRDRDWLAQQWQIARYKCKIHKGPYLLVVDEIQKIEGWSELIKSLWDEDTFHSLDLRVIILGSSTLIMQKGLTDSLAGRFEITPITHWVYSEMKDAFQFSVEDWIYFGGYLSLFALNSLLGINDLIAGGTPCCFGERNRSSKSIDQEDQTMPPKKGALAQPLFEATQRGDHQTMRILLIRGADPDGITRQNIGRGKSEMTSSLTIAATQGDVTAAHILLVNGANINAIGTWGSAALTPAVRAEKVEMVKFLLEKGAGVKDHSSQYADNSSLVWAAKTGNQEIFTLLRTAGADPNAKGVTDQGFQTPLQAALSEGKSEMVTQLLNDPAVKPNEHNLPLLFAEKGDEETMKRLLNFPFDFDAALWRAKRAKNRGTEKALLDYQSARNRAKPICTQHQENAPQPKGLPMFRAVYASLYDAL